MGREVAGSKGRNLMRLENHGVRVPRGFLLEELHYRTAMESLREPILRALPRSREIEQLFARASVSSEALKAIEDGLSRLPGVARFAVRSSGMVWCDGRAMAEDGHAVALAGQFESYLGVAREDVPAAVKACWASLFNQRSIDNFAIGRDYLENSAMAVVIQEMVVAESSAVMMTADPLGDGSTGGIESTWGACEAIVSGRVSPDFVAFDRLTGQITQRVLGSKETTVCHGPLELERQGTHERATEPMRRREFSLTEEQLFNLVRLGAQIERIFGGPQDVEAVFANGEFTITQSRAVTTPPVNLVPFLPGHHEGSGDQA